MELWHRQPNEPALWHGRFQTYLSLGPQRSVYAAYVATWQEQAKTPAGSAPGSWNDTARRDQWAARADAYDTHQQERAAAALDESMTKLRIAGPKAAQQLIKLLTSESEDQARLAANSILNRIGAIHTTQADENGRIPITTIEVITPPPVAEPVEAQRFTSAAKPAPTATNEQEHDK